MGRELRKPVSKPMHTDPSDARGGRPVLAGKVRAALLITVVMGNAGYAASFLPLRGAVDCFVMARAVAVAAAASWPIFGAALTAAGGRRVPIEVWFDRCLIVMNAGIAILAGAAVVNVCMALAGVTAGGAVAAMHAGILLIADAVMGSMFANAARSPGFSAKRAWLLWIVVLNGAFAAMLAGQLWLQGAVPW